MSKTLMIMFGDTVADILWPAEEGLLEELMSDSRPPRVIDMDPAEETVVDVKNARFRDAVSSEV